MAARSSAGPSVLCQLLSKPCVAPSGTQLGPAVPEVGSQVWDAPWFSYPRHFGILGRDTGRGCLPRCQRTP